ncbi:MAG: 50S ribosomal protein L22 [Candidatus Hodarchaeales archaeon]|jgi:large subunit ribosomal protein L22
MSTKKKPNKKYAQMDLDPDESAIALGNNLAISPKHAREICRELKGKGIEEAKDYLDEVIAKKRAVPFKRYRKKIGHRRGLKGWDAGRYPVKAAAEIKKLIESLENNVTFKELNVPEMRLTHIYAMKGRKIRGIYPRAQGSSSPKIQTLVHIQIACEKV